eukprot:1933189-Karenia_brevis.AAC.1
MRSALAYVLPGKMVCCITTSYTCRAMSFGNAHHAFVCSLGSINELAAERRLSGPGNAKNR